MKMIFKRLLISSVIVVVFGCQSLPQNREEAHDGKFTNRLIDESSPYLLQHAHNPVDWYPWGKEALEKAEKENKLIVISIGYSSCHWCHVMEKESFSDDEVANFMNENFVSIKVDREERPDIDQIFVDASNMMTGRAGWPLNAITLPDKRPIFTGTYFPKDQWTKVLGKIQTLWNDEPEKLLKLADDVEKGLKDINAIELNMEQTTFSKTDVNRIFDAWLEQFDHKEGGYDRAPKFPLPSTFQTLLNYYNLTGKKEFLDITTLTLDKMASGGLYDQIGGGFARYSTDGYWKVPHFEKMLYDNGQLLSLYANAYRITGDSRYENIINETIAFMHREWLSN